MSLFKYIDRVKTIHKLIEAEKTGTSDEFAARVHISRSLLMEHLRELRDSFNAPITYCRRRKTFYYKSQFKFQIIVDTGMRAIKGGSRIAETLLPAEPVLSDYFYSKQWLMQSSTAASDQISPGNL